MTCIESCQEFFWRDEGRKNAYMRSIVGRGENVGIGGNCRRGKYSMSQQDLLIFMKNSEDKKTLRVFLLPDCISIQLLSVH